MGGRSYVVIFALAAATACQDDAAKADGGDETGTTSASTGSTESESESESGQGSTESDDGGTEETGDPEPYCGDGNLDEAEECDDGNEDDSDGCSNECVSACGADFATDIRLPIDTEWWDIQVIRPQMGGAVTLMGGVWNQDAGRLRVATFMDNLLSDEIEGAPLGPGGDIHELSAAAMTASGEILALGRSVDPVENYWLARFDGSDLSEVWRVPLTGTDPDYRPMGLAVLDDGDPVLTRTSSESGVDDDALLARHAFTDGAEQWSATYSGELNAGYSFDEAWGVAAGAGDALWGMARFRVDYQTHDTTVLRVDPSDGTLMDSFAPLSDPGGNHRQRPAQIAAGQNGDMAIGLTVYGPASKWSFSRAYRYMGSEMVFELTREDLPWEDGDPYLDPRVAIDEDGNTLISGTYTHDFGFATAARVWVVKVDPDGELICYARVGEGNNGGVVPRNGFFGSGRAAVNLDSYGPGGMGPGSGNNWLLGLRQ